MNKHCPNPDQFKCDWPEFRSELQKNWKDFSDEDLTEIEGDYEKFVSMVQKRCRDKKRTLCAGPPIGTPDVNSTRPQPDNPRYHEIKCSTVTLGSANRVSIDCT